MSTLLLTFANSNTNPLPTLTEEFDGVSDALRMRHARKDFTLVKYNTDRPDPIISDIKAYLEDITIFLFSGHAGSKEIIFSDGKSPAEALADSLGECPNLKLVILNGCSTAGQVKSLLNKNIPIVIATSSPVDDKKATRFSIAFFREMSIDKTINEAFDIAVKDSNWLGSYQEAKKVARGLVLSEEEDDDKPMWGLYYSQPEGEILMNTFRLPTLDINNNQYGINDEIKESLTGIAETYEVDPSKEKMLALLPYLISEPIRKLLTPKEGTGVFYDSPSKDRFKMLLFAYRAIINLATYTLLAQLWDEGLKNGKESIMTGQCQNLFKSTFFKGKEGIEYHSNLELLKQLLHIIKDKGLSFFIPEMAFLLDTLNETDTKTALDDLESKLAKEGELVNAPDLLNLCLQTESSLARTLFDFGFMIKYSLTSIPNIECIKNHRLNSHVYRHRFLTLRNQADALRKEDEQLVSDFPLDNSSVIIHKHGDRSTNLNLNLSPFLVDKNALDNASKPDLHFLEYFLAQTNTFYYRPATSYKNLWEVSPEEIKVPGKSKYSSPKQAAATPELDASLTFNALLNKQIKSFASIVLNKTPNEL